MAFIFSPSSWSKNKKENNAFAVVGIGSYPHPTLSANTATMATCLYSLCVSDRGFAMLAWGAGSLPPKSKFKILISCWCQWESRQAGTEIWCGFLRISKYFQRSKQKLCIFFSLNKAAKNLITICACTESTDKIFIGRQSKYPSGDPIPIRQ